MKNHKYNRFVLLATAYTYVFFVLRIFSYYYLRSQLLTEASIFSLWQDLAYVAVSILIINIGSKIDDRISAFIASIIMLLTTILYVDLGSIFLFSQRFDLNEFYMIISTLSIKNIIIYAGLFLLCLMLLIGSISIIFIIGRKRYRKLIPNNYTLLVLIILALIQGLLSSTNDESHSSMGSLWFINAYRYVDPIGHNSLSEYDLETIENLLPLLKEAKTPVRSDILSVIATKDPTYFIDHYNDFVGYDEETAAKLLSDIYRDMSSNTLDDYYELVKGNNAGGDIIILILESLSAVDSKRTSGLQDNLPLLDQVLSEGKTFTNFSSNAQTSERGHIALFNGILPLTFEKYGTTYYDRAESYTTPLPQFFNELGYDTRFYSTVSLDFLNQHDYLSRIGFSNNIVDQHHFSEAKKYGFDAAPDHILYNGILEDLSVSARPQLIVGQTISSHEPYYVPTGYGEKNMFQYVDESLYEFYHKLKNRNFFDDGILILVADHRKRAPLTQEEIDLYGSKASVHVVAGIIGKDIGAGEKDDNIYQHTDVYFSLIKRYGSGNVLVSTTYNDLFDKSIQRYRGLKEQGVGHGILRFDGGKSSTTLELSEGRISSTSYWDKQKEAIDYVQALYNYSKEKPLKDKSVRKYIQKLLSLEYDSVANIIDIGADGILTTLDIDSKGQLLIGGVSIESIEKSLMLLKENTHYNLYIDCRLPTLTDTAKKGFDAIISQLSDLNLLEKTVFLVEDDSMLGIIGSYKNTHIGWWMTDNLPSDIGLKNIKYLVIENALTDIELKKMDNLNILPIAYGGSRDMDGYDIIITDNIQRMK